MVTKSKLKMALAAEKGTDFNKLKLKKKAKGASKRKPAALVVEDRGADDGSEDDDVLEEGHEDEEEKFNEVCNSLSLILERPRISDFA